MANQEESTNAPRETVPAGGAALKKLGRNDEAQEKFASAEALELVPSERALLTAVL